MKVNTYPAMNETIKDLLRMNQDEPMKAYTLARIEELEQENMRLQAVVKGYRGREKQRKKEIAQLHRACRQYKQYMEDVWIE